MKNSNDTIGNRTSDLPACSARPQPIAPPRAPVFIGSDYNYMNPCFESVLLGSFCETAVSYAELT
jgi:hypothetical protein